MSRGLTSRKELNILLPSLAFAFAAHFAFGSRLRPLHVRLKGEARYVEPNEVVGAPTQLLQGARVPLFQ